MEKIQITIAELEALLQNEETEEATLERYFDPEFSDPFKPGYKLKENVEVLYPEGEEGELAERGFQEFVMKLANIISRNKRRRKFKKKIEEDPNSIRVVSEGDSWFQYPHPKVIDIIDHLSKDFAVYSVGAAGDELNNMYKEQEYLEAIEKVNPSFFLLSGGGNDLLGKGFRYYLRSDFEAASTGENPGRFLKNSFFSELERLGDIYRTILKRITKLKPGIKILIHGYDYIIPGDEPDKGWLGRYMIENGMKDQKDRQALINLIIDCFNETIKENSQDLNNVFYIDCRACVPEDKWYDEIHPDSLGFGDVANLFKKQIEQLSGVNA